MFHKNIVELQKIRKFVDCRSVDLADDPLLSQTLSDVSYQITIIVKDLVRVDSIINEREKKNGIQ